MIKQTCIACVMYADYLLLASLCNISS